MNHLIDQQLRRNDCGISAVKTVCNILEIPIPRTIIEDSVFLDEQGASLDSIQKFFVNNGFLTQYKLVDINTLNDNSKEYQALFPCITPVKNKGSLHYVVLNGLQNEKFKVLDPAEMRHYTLSVQEFKKKAYFSSTQMQYVDVSEKLRVSIYQELKQRRIHLPHEPSDKELITLFNKFTYFSYICENFGFKDEQAENAFLKDLIFNQDVGAVPSHFRSMKLEKAKVQIKAPILLSVKKGEDLAQFTPPEDPTENVYWKLFKSISSVKDIWMIFVVTAMIAAFINYVAVFINQILIDHILPSYQLDTLILFAVGIGIFSLFDMIFYTYKKFISIHLGNTLDKYFLQVFDQKLNNYSIRYLQSFKRGDLTERLSDSLKIKSFFMRYFSKIFINAIIALFSIGLLMMLHMQLTFIVIVVLICFLVIFYVLTPIIKQLERQRFTQKAQFFSKFIEKIDGIQVIKAMR
ncbi:MAG: ABC transporter transmembrane domain-containing protein, partial [Chitinophagales bacterium]